MEKENQKNEVELALELEKNVQKVLDKWLVYENPKWQIKGSLTKFCEELLTAMKDYLNFRNSQLLKKEREKLREEIEKKRESLIFENIKREILKAETIELSLGSITKGYNCALDDVLKILEEDKS